MALQSPRLRKAHSGNWLCRSLRNVKRRWNQNFGVVGNSWGEKKPQACWKLQGVFWTPNSPNTLRKRRLVSASCKDSQKTVWCPVLGPSGAVAGHLGWNKCFNMKQFSSCGSLKEQNMFITFVFGVEGSAQRFCTMLCGSQGCRLLQCHDQCAGKGCKVGRIFAFVQRNECLSSCEPKESPILLR